ncbi:UNVERIFIED_CONTAM: hypothetical protein H355_008345, partial [Colinus virginianus]
MEDQAAPGSGGGDEPPGPSRMGTKRSGRSSEEESRNRPKLRDRISNFRKSAVRKEKPHIQHPIDTQPTVSEIPLVQALVDERCMNLSEKEVMDLFEKMMEDMNLNEERKAPLRDKDLSTKREMVVQYISATAKSGGLKNSKHECTLSSQEYIHELRSGISDEKLLNCLESLRVSLTSNPVSWVNNFGHEGLGLLLDALERLLDKKQQENIDKKNQHKLIQCLKAFMNNKYGLQRILGDERSLLLLSRAVDPKQPHMMTETVKILSAICIVGEEKVLDKVLGAITTAAERNNRERFSLVVEGLENHEFLQLQVACMQFINALVTSPEELDFRIHLRNEFLRCGLKKILPVSSLAQYYKIIEECISQIVLHSSGMDPDFGYRGRMDVDFTHLIDAGVNKAKLEESEKKAAEFSKKFDEEFTARQEAQVALEKREEKIKELEAEIKRLQSQIEPCKIAENSFWVKAEESKFESPELFARLAVTFGSQKKPKKSVEKPEDEKKKDQPKKKNKLLRVLDFKTSQNISIFLGSLRMPYEEIRKVILEIDEEKLTETFVQSIMKNLPEQEVINAIVAFRDEYDDLSESEQFIIVMDSVKMLKARLKAILFKLSFEEHVNNIKPGVRSITLACEELRKSESFSKLLELVLFLGNYMNTGSRNEQSLGFNITFLCKIIDTKSVDQKTTLLHFLAEVCEDNYRDILKFTDELQNLDSASKDLIPIGSFSLTKSYIFAKEAREQYDKLVCGYNNMIKLYENLGEYFTFDAKSVSMEEFFCDLNKFKILFLSYLESKTPRSFYLMQEALKENNKRREMEEKMKRAKLAREKAEQEKLERQKNKQQLLGMNKEGDETGVMDNLLEALQSGAAFRGRRRRAPR